MYRCLRRSMIGKREDAFPFREIIAHTDIMSRQSIEGMDSREVTSRDPESAAIWRHPRLIDTSFLWQYQRIQVLNGNKCVIVGPLGSSMSDTRCAACKDSISALGEPKVELPIPFVTIDPPINHWNGNLKQVIFSDESCYNVDYDDERVFIRCCRDTKQWPRIKEYGCRSG